MLNDTSAGSTAGTGTGTTATSPTVPMRTLIALIVGSMVGAGIFSLPQNIGSVAAPGAMLIGWVIAGFGMLSVAFVFHVLARRKPHLDSGVYSYARVGLGDFVGFCSAWGYWLGSVIAQVGYATLFFSTLGHYVPLFSADNPVISALAVSVLTWLIFAVVAGGVKQAAFLTTVTTVVKILPLLAFIILVAFLGFSWDKFTVDFWGTGTDSTVGSVFDQVKSIMVFTVWVFIGVEGASVYSRQARSRQDISRATIIGFFAVLALLVTISSLSFGVLTQQELAVLPDNSMASVLEAVVGEWGAALISAGLCLSVLGAYVSWQMLCAEPLALMAVDGLIPRKVGAINSRGAAWMAQLISTIVIQVFIVIFFLNETTYVSMVQLATVLYLVPYFFAALYLVALATRGRGIRHAGAGTLFDDSGPLIPAPENRRHAVIGIAATVYSIWLFYAADPKYLLFGAIAILPGLIPYVWTRLYRKEKVFNTFEWGVLGILIVAAGFGLLGLIGGGLTL
ncbi:Arginine/ornithine antiporter [Corynebacterium faecale]|nr:amino acid permease [Corynebacterium faecale]WJY91705.1 Arginine/ornithine antiporter [Corynebacterium faecale]